jgi:hypothetical protein
MFSFEETRAKLVTSMINLIRFPNQVTLFFLDLINDVLFNKQVKENSIRELILTNISERMNAEGPRPWGLVYLSLQLQIHSN